MFPNLANDMHVATFIWTIFSPMQGANSFTAHGNTFNVLHRIVVGINCGVNCDDDVLLCLMVFPEITTVDTGAVAIISSCKLSTCLVRVLQEERTHQDSDTQMGG